jgi:hypothetical protein
LKKEGNMPTKYPYWMKGGWSVWDQNKTLPPESKKILEDVLDTRRSLLDELESSGHVRASDLLLIDQAMFKLFYIRLIDDWCIEHGPLLADEGKLRLQPALGTNYLAFSNSMRLDLQAVKEGKDRAIKWDFVKAIREVSEDDKS